MKRSAASGRYPPELARRARRVPRTSVFPAAARENQARRTCRKDRRQIRSSGLRPCGPFLRRLDWARYCTPPATADPVRRPRPGPRRPLQEEPGRRLPRDWPSETPGPRLAPHHDRLAREFDADARVAGRLLARVHRSSTAVISDDETRRSSIFVASTTSKSIPASAHQVRRIVTSPRRSCPNAKFGPSMMPRACNWPRITRSKKSRAESSSSQGPVRKTATSVAPAS